MAMAAAAAPKGGVPLPPAAYTAPPKLMVESNTVATQFVQQYYHVLSNWPENLHRFYTDASTLSHCVVGEETTHTQTQRGIHEKVMSLGLQGAVPQILSVDAQTSIGGGVVVHTTGFLTLKGSKPRPFAQVFFLAVQEIGYFVLNDLFCWLQKEEVAVKVEAKAARNQVPKQAAPASAAAMMAPPAVRANNAVPSAPPSAMAEKKAAASEGAAQGLAPAAAAAATTSEQKPRPVAEAPPAPVPVAQHKAPAGAPVNHEASKAKDSQQPPAAAQAAAGATQQQQQPAEGLDAPILTYAQRLKMAAARKAAPQSVPGEEAAPAQAIPPPQQPPQQQQQRVAGEHQAVQDASSSIFVRNLPQSITEETLVSEFSKFGPCRVTLKNVQKGMPYAFIDFQSPQVAASAVGAALKIDGKQLEIAEKKPTILSKNKKSSKKKFKNKA
mmetsp:Transcript_7985/g.20498  ORF Transcript_7985/g.20498 Transcript_7985/m.20498 type:complete len:440 (-) Transcript_7985:889-2208(-)|eukprot:CAMPEP_0197488418 /NCGR_PEP_ID=MMETSP1311-20131121/3373_1 /TAXON_ID=464262 /ORGANISM="Genus nov. species nov., Strain RCC856" /LENGTH=439 /DNA_ID=CAMNT_0043032449 /DNA_START=146 /DNA_END=1465 /DNA_ORIENTATION=+